jgi:hypothetical protein
MFKASIDIHNSSNIKNKTSYLKFLFFTFMGNIKFLAELLCWAPSNVWAIIIQFSVGTSLTVLKFVQTKFWCRMTCQNITHNIMLHNWNIVMCMCVTIDRVWIGEWMYWPLIHLTRNYKHLQHYRWPPHFTNHYTLSLLQPAVSSLVIAW